MTGNLLDTNVALIAVTEPIRLSAAIRSALLSGRNVISVVSYWEVMLKSMKGKLDVEDPREWWSDTLRQLRAKPLALNAEHIAAVYALPALHQDPFDRILVAQARVGGLGLLTTDVQITAYAEFGLRIVS